VTPPDGVDIAQPVATLRRPRRIALPRPLRRPAVRRLHPFVPLVVCALWGIAISGIDARDITDVGLISVTPISVLVLLGVLSISFALTFVGSFRPWVAFVHVVALIVMLYGVTAFIEPVSRFSPVYTHVGVIDYIVRHGGVDPKIDAYFNWPGFFSFGALLVKIAGVHNALAFAAWGPLAFNLLYLAPLLVIFRWAGADARLTWLALWIFYCTNWVGQDYFAPQAVGYLMWLSIAAVLLLHFAPAPRELALRPSVHAIAGTVRPRAVREWVASWIRPKTAPVFSPQRIGLLLIVVAVYTATVTGHQLTPFPALVAVTGLVLFAGLETRGLPLLMGFILAAWIAYMTTTFLAGHIGDLTKTTGSLGKNLNQSLTHRVGGSPGHELVAHIRFLGSAGIWCLALVGIVRRLGSRRIDSALLVLGAAPLLLPALQPYGGEILLRVYLFALPSVAFFIAAIAFPSLRSRSGWITVAAVAVTSFVLLGLFQYTRYGNERLDAYTPGDRAAVSALYRIAPPGSTLIAGTYNIPWRDRDYERYDYRLLTDLSSWRNDIDSPVPIAKQLTTEFGKRGAYVIITRSTEIAADLILGRTNDLRDLSSVLRTWPYAKQLYRARDGEVFYIKKT
jgi:hypothetical protein